MKPTQNKMSTDMNMPYLLQSHLHRDAIAYIPDTYIDIVWSLWCRACHFPFCIDYVTITNPYETLDAEQQLTPKQIGQGVYPIVYNEHPI